MDRISKTFYLVAFCCTAAALNFVTFVMEVANFQGKNMNDRQVLIILAVSAILIGFTAIYLKADDNIKQRLVFPFGVCWSAAFGIGLYLLIRLTDGDDIQRLWSAGMSAFFFAAMLIYYTALLQRRRRGGLILLGAYAGVCLNMINVSLQRLGTSNFLNFQKYEGLSKTVVCVLLGTCALAGEIMLVSTPAYSDFGAFLQGIGYVCIAMLCTYIYSEGVSSGGETVIFPLTLSALAALTVIYYNANAPESKPTTPE